ncbi:MAG TPA: class I SAM-dependent methyltransferase [Opitutales bacterium]|jgi:caffeoyl-CoA O-methyltransferase|nr:class I SAM-dependent methyltransferase [Opitutales bacterium]
MKAVPWHVRRNQRGEALKYTAMTDGLYRYASQCRSGTDDALLEKLRAETGKKFPDTAPMQIARDQGTLMTLLVAAIGARSAIEVGSFTGYSAICIARGLPAKGKLLCLDQSAEWTNLAQKYWAKAGVKNKIELRLGPALDSLKKLESKWKFDFAFIDANKTGYDDYYELILPRMRANGLILFDNMLWGGRLARRVAHPDGKAIDLLNRKLARDSRVESVLLPISDGINICRVRG